MRVGMLAYSFYESDNRVRRYAEALAGRGDQVDVFCLRRPHQPDFEILKGVAVYRIQERIIDEQNPFSYLLKLLKFLSLSAIHVTRRHWRARYQLIHVHSIPDFEVFAASLPRWAGAKVILDIHDLVPEFFASKFQDRGKGGFFFRNLLRVEKASIQACHHTIIANHLWRNVLVARSVSPEKCTVFLNYPDPAIFHPRLRPINDHKFRMIYPGTLNWHQGIDLAVRAFSFIKDQIPQGEFHIYGKGSERLRVQKLIAELGIGGRVFLHDLVPLEQIAEIMAQANLGIVPKRKDSFGDQAFSTKILEFMALGVPVLAADTQIDRYYFNDSVLRFFKSGDVADLAREMLTLARNRELRETLAANAAQFAEEYSWGKKKYEYFHLVDNLTGNKATPEKSSAAGWV